MTVPYTILRNTVEDPTWRVWATEPPPQDGGGGGDPGGGGGSVLPYLGWALDSEAQFTGFCGQVGQILARRSYNTPTTGVPVSYAVSAAKNDRSLGATISYTSIKPSITDTASGALDAKLAAFAQSCPAGTYVSWWPEGEAHRHGNDPTQFRTALRRVYQVMKAANSGILIGPCFMTYTLTAAANNPITQWFIAPISQSADFISWDGYNEGSGGTSWTSFTQVMGPALAWTKANSDLPMIIGEVGSNADPNNAQRRAQWWTDGWNYCVAQQFPLVCGWQGSAFPGYTIYQPNDNSALAAVGNINTAAKVGR